MQAVIRFVFVAILLFPGSLWAQQGDSPPVVIQAVTKMLPRLQARFAELRAGDLLVLDLDNTVFREVQMLGTDEWYSHVLNEMMVTQKLSRHQAADQLEPLNNAIKDASRMRLMEEGLPALIRDLQDRGVAVIGLTARHPNLANITLRQLHELGIDFSRSQLDSRGLEGFKLPELHNAFLFKDAIAFTDGSPKGLVLKAIVPRMGLKPAHVVAVDDRIHHVHTLVEALLEMQTPGYVVHYLRVLEERPFDPAIADVQRREFEKTGLLLSDFEAESVLRHQLCAERVAGPKGSRP